MADIKEDDFKRLVTLYAPEMVSSIAFSPDGSLLAIAAGDKVHLYSVPKYQTRDQNENLQPK